MLNEIRDRVGKKKSFFWLFTSVILIAHSGANFVFIIPWTDRYSFYMLAMYLLLCFIISTVYIGIYQHGQWFTVFLHVLLLHSIGLLWRVLLEWGEFGNTEFLTQPLFIGYLLTIPLFITICYVLMSRLQKDKVH